MKISMAWQRKGNLTGARSDRANPVMLIRWDRPPADSPAMEHTKARILHVDDHQDTRLMMAALLQDRGYGVLTAGSVGEALELAKEINFDLYILDVRLPDGTGVELCQKLHEMRPGVPILYYSAYGDAAEVERSLAICGNAYLKKPVCIGDLESQVAKLLTGARK
jgi:two-component system OmpR family response regulator